MKKGDSAQAVAFGVVAERLLVGWMEGHSGGSETRESITTGPFKGAAMLTRLREGWAAELRVAPQSRLLAGQTSGNESERAENAEPAKRITHAAILRPRFATSSSSSVSDR